MTNYPSAESPWAAHTNVKSVRVSPNSSWNSDSRKNVKISCNVPGSKSVTNRAIILAAFATGSTILHHILKSDDTYWCIKAIECLGCKVELIEEPFTGISDVKITGLGGQIKLENKEPIFIGAAGTIARFLPGLIASCTFAEPITLTPDHSLAKRPVAPLIEGLKQLGAKIEFIDEPNHYPIKIFPNGLAGGKIEISGKVSSQYLSGLLLAAPLAKGQVSLEITDHLVQPQYVDITTNLMRTFGAEVVKESDKNFEVKPSTYKATEYYIEGDASSAGYLFALAAIHGIEVTVSNVGTASTQPDIKLLRFLEKLGCEVTQTKYTSTVKGPTKLKGGYCFDLNEISDQTPTLAAIAPFCENGLELRNIKHIRKHECDRIYAMSHNLRRTGIEVEEFDDGLKIQPGFPMQTEVDSFNDHRIAMSMALIGSKSAEISILTPSCVAKTFPDFFNVLKSMGIGVEEA